MLFTPHQNPMLWASLNMRPSSFFCYTVSQVSVPIKSLLLSHPKRTPTQGITCRVDGRKKSAQEPSGDQLRLFGANVHRHTPKTALKKFLRLKERKQKEFHETDPRREIPLAIWTPKAIFPKWQVAIESLYLRSAAEEEWERPASLQPSLQPPCRLAHSWSCKARFGFTSEQGQCLLGLE